MSARRAVVGLMWYLVDGLVHTGWALCPAQNTCDETAEMAAWLRSWRDAAAGVAEIEAFLRSSEPA